MDIFLEVKCSVTQNSRFGFKEHFMEGLFKDNCIILSCLSGYYI